MNSGREGPRGGRAGVLARTAVALLLACAGLAVAPVAARAAGPAAAACAADAGAKGPAGDAVPGSLVSVDRGDGRIGQLRLFQDATATAGPSFVWYREQGAPDGAYGPWRRVSATPVSPGGGTAPRAFENPAGDLELLFASRGSLCHAVRSRGAEGWSTPVRTSAGAASAPAPASGPVSPGGDGVRIQPIPVGPPSFTGARLDVGRTTGLLDGDIVRFTVAGGPPKAYVWVKQCAPQASGSVCDDATGRQFRVYPDGTYQLSPKKLYAQVDTPTGSFDCRTAPAARPCTLALTDNDGTVLTAVPLRFRPDGRPEAPPTLRVDPDQALMDGQTVHATGRGYEPQYHSLVMECAAGSADTLGCRPRSRPPATTDSGRLDERIVLSATFTAIDGRTVDCRARGACELVVFGTRVRGPDAVRHRLEFAPAAG
ncbi:neocarzinostatin apoprotein domain-containing protein [Streptomyces sp. NBC_00435]|uniref:neocarzinostatin apoprotein domain-containing protein n=1 Tax=Streptomyces sp. NBC_00435 TaxID=2903649 RepID=UPI002E24380F